MQPLPGVIPMGRRRAGASKPAEPTDPDDRVALIHLKGTRSYLDWLESRHRETHIAKTILFRLAMKEYAAKMGWPEPPEF